MSLNGTPGTVASGEEMTFTANVTAGYNPTGTVTFKEGGSVLGTSAIDASGSASWTAGCLNPGSHTISATYGGDDFNGWYTKNLAVTVTGSKKCTNTQLTSLTNPSGVGKPIKLEATVTGSGTAAPTGAVTFKEGTVVLGTAQLNRDGQALAVISRPRGDHQITAVYAGDGQSLGSTSAPFTQHVANSDVQATLTADRPAALLGSSVTYTVTARNNGPDTAYATQAGFRLSNSAATVTGTTGPATTTPYPVNYQPSQVAWNLGDLAPGQSKTVTVTVLVTGGSASFTGMAAAGNPVGSNSDTLLTNNTSATTVKVIT